MRNAVRPSWMAVSRLGIGLLAVTLACFTGSAFAVDPEPRAARLLHGSFASSDEQRAFERSVAKALGGEVRIANPADDPFSDGAESDLFGYSVALSGNTAVVGAGTDDNLRGIDAGAVYVFVRSGSSWSQQAKLTAGDGVSGDLFGVRVAISGETALVGSFRGDSPTATNSGSAYVFVRSGTTWSQQAELLASDGLTDDSFGFAVALDGDTALVGAYLDDLPGNNNAGSAYVYVRSGTSWSEQTKLLAADGLADDQFGFNVALSGDTALVGAYQDDTAAGNGAGSAHVFTRSGTVWSPQAQLFAPDAAASDGFGYAVALAADTALISAANDDTLTVANVGSVHVFTRSGTVWTPQAQLFASDAALNDSLGTFIALSGDTALIGAYQDDTAGGANAGSAYVFIGSGASWSQQAQLSAADGAPTDFFGTVVALSGDSALIGVPQDDTIAGANAGSARVFTRSASVWSAQTTLSAGDGGGGDQFGISVSIDGDTALIGAWQADAAAGSNSGAVYVFVHDGSSWVQQARLSANDAAPDDRFGISVALSGDTALIGSLFDDTAAGADAGSAYVFVRSGTSWSQQAKLTAPDAAPNDRFAQRVALDGDSAVIGAPFATVLTSNLDGTAYVFVRSGTSWSHQQQLAATNRDALDRFGSEVAIDGNTVLVSAPFEGSFGGDNRGSVYVFTRSGVTWTQQQQLNPLDAASNDQFGTSVAIDADTALVGTEANDLPGVTDAGSAYVFTRSGTIWTEQTQLTAADAAMSDNFGCKVAVVGDTALIGARNDDLPGGMNAGSAYVFMRSGTSWTQQTKLTASDGTQSDAFGQALALSPERALIGAPADGSSVTGDVLLGAVYVYSQTYTLTYAAGANGSISGTTLQTVSHGDDGTAVTAVPAPNYHFVQWSDASIANPRTDTNVTANISVTATFAINTYTLTYNAGPNGSISGTSPQTVDHGADGTAVTAVPDAGHLFLQWSDGSSANPRTDTNITQDLTVTAQFVAENYTLTYSAAANGSISGTSPQTVAYGGNGTPVTAVPNLGYRFVQWSDSQTANPRTDSNVSADVSVTASFANDAPTLAAVADDVRLEDSSLRTINVTVADTETPAANLILTAASSQTALIADPTIGNGATAGERTVSYLPSPDQHGGPVTITLTLTDAAGATAQRTFTVTVTSVNDAPTVAFGSIATHAAGSSGAQTIPGFATVDFGPADEDATQTVADYLIDSIVDPAGVLVGGSLDIANNGTLTYTLTGVGGSATISARVRDNGGNVDGGQDTSSAVGFTISVSAGADLAITKDNGRSGLLDGEITVYALVATNAGPNAANGATLVDTLPANLINGSWMCVQAASTATCPTPNAGNGNLNISVDLGVGQQLQFDLMAEVDGSIGAFVTNTASIAPPPGTTALNPSDDSATDQDPIVPVGIFANGFE